MVGPVAVIEDCLRHSDVAELIKVVRPRYSRSRFDSVDQRDREQSEKCEIKPRALAISPLLVGNPSHLADGVFR